jgi:HD-GYP domain-containing protein (c-di-GMP phosphodiesterase class II)
LEMIREEAKLDFSAAWKGKCTDSLLVEATQFTHAIAEVCSDGIDTSSVLHSLIAHDSDTFTHVSNVCTYAIILSQHLGVTDKVKLTEIGLAALLHDLGKRKINQNILKKPGPLTDEERSIIYDHPRLGFEELCDKEALNQEQLLMIYHHHEKLNGTGYPVGLVGEEISWGARLCTVLDVFDAFTVRRAYRKAVTVDDALIYLEENSNTFFAAEMVKCWSNLVRNVISK